ncbi:MAG: PTS fructose transporter subunit IIA [Elusimicrobia bacterium]|nr:PTS fructose transporter subunit IIA [Elusimicrobiota bacterium]
MINFIIVTHGEFGAYLVEAAESIVGQQIAGLRAISISSRLSVPEIRERIAKAVKELRGPDGLILLTDMPGGTPSNLSFPLIKDEPNAEMISGVNLNMLVCAFSHRADMPLQELVEKLMADGQRAVRDIRKMFLSGAAKAR